MISKENDISAEVVVAGGGLAGTFAAIAAARLGCKTVLIQDRPVLGGNASSELLVGICGADCSGSALARYVRESGLVDEFALQLLRRSSNFASAAPLHSVILWEMAQREANLSLYLNTSVRDVSKNSGGNIASIRASQISTEKEFTFEGRIFIDCTGHGTLGALAGAEFRMGREARTEFGETLAPELADRKTMGNSLIFCARDMGRPVPFTAPAWARKFPTDADLPFRHPGMEKLDLESDEICGFWWIEYGGEKNTIDDAEAIHDELLKILYGVWDHMKNTGDHGVANYAITWICPFPSMRESRRLIGEYILNENDLRARTVFPDRVAYGGWAIDIHPPGGIYAGEPPCTHEYLPGPCSIPLRSLYSKNISNLLFAGRNASASHVALGTVRVMATCAVMGQAAGTAAALCLRHKSTPRQLGRERIVELQQQLLKDDCYLVGMKNADPEDFARGAVVSASSEATLDLRRADDECELKTPAAQMFPVSADRLEKVELLLRSECPGPARLSLGLRSAATINDFSSAEDLAVAQADIFPGKRQWIAFDFNLPLPADRYYWIHLPAVPGVHWAIQRPSPHGVNRATWSMMRDKECWRSIPSSGHEQGNRGAFVMRLTPAARPYGPSNVVNGVNRPEQGANLWMSDPASPWPHSLELKLPAPAVIGQIRITFDDDLDANIYLPPPWGRLGRGLMPTLMKSYAVFAFEEGAWKMLLQEEDNQRRLCVHDFPAVRTDRIRLEYRASHGAAEARVYEIRLYGP